jgi:hypothetical protein
VCPFASVSNLKSQSKGGLNLARSNYSYKKRQKELARMKKQEEKRKRKLDKGNPAEEESIDQVQQEKESL